jgi:rfaE bifunctional protein kinase chain/domain
MEIGEALRRRLLALVHRLAGKRVLVVGDMVADEYITGAPLKISREAPVLVLRHRGQHVTPGGATNPAVNARTLGAEVLLAGVVGDDAPGEQLRARLAEYGVRMDGLFTTPDRPTSTKTRVVAGDTQLVQQQIVRIDRIDDSDLDAAVTRRITGYLREAIPAVDALIISDYENGVISPAILTTALMLAREHGLIVVADSHGDLARFQGVTALTPNQPEAEATLGVPLADIPALESGGRQLLELTGAQATLITRGSHGMSLLARYGAPLHLPASNLTAVADPTGAGDTVAATFTLALAADGAYAEATDEIDEIIDGASSGTPGPVIAHERLADAAALANIAAGLVVRRIGCATNTPAELAAAINALAPTPGPSPVPGEGGL